MRNWIGTAVICAVMAWSGAPAGALGPDDYVERRDDLGSNCWVQRDVMPWPFASVSVVVDGDAMRCGTV